MDGAALLLVVSGVGVGFGWQPMPDASPRYEYIVQIEPELAATLADGKSIPIASDIPDEIQPVGRIRVVVGRGDLPRQRLVTRLKPTDESAALQAPGPSGGQSKPSGVELAQYNQFGDGRYSGPQAQAQPRYGQSAAAGAVAQPQRAAALQSDSTQWNADQGALAASAPAARVAAAPTAQQLFGSQTADSASSWNDDAAQAAATLVAPIARAGEQLEKAAQPLRDGLEKVDDRVRTAADEFGSRTRRLADELGRPFSQQPPLVSSQQARQPATNAGTPTEPPATWNPGATIADDNSLRSGADGGAGWNQDAAADSDNGWNGGATNTPAADVWAGVPDPRRQTAGGQVPLDAQAPDLSGLAPPFAGAGASGAPDGPAFPADAAIAATTPLAAGNATGSSAGSVTSPSGKASVDRGMLGEAPGRPLDADQAAQPALGGFATARPSTQPAASNWPASTTAASETKSAATQPAETGPAAAGRNNAALVLAAWVLLSGSVAGNLYLFWSYLDVRQKYRALVRKTARAVGSRFSAA